MVLLGKALSGGSRWSLCKGKLLETDYSQCILSLLSWLTATSCCVSSLASMVVLMAGEFGHNLILSRTEIVYQ